MGGSGGGGKASAKGRRASKLAESLTSDQRTGLKDALEVVSRDRQRLEDEGLSQVSFTLGVLNIAFTAFVCGRFPEYFWLWHTLKSVSLTSLQVYRWFGLRRQYYMLDLCWVITFLGILWGVMECFTLMDLPARRLAFIIFFSFANGPLGWSVSLLQNRLVFHSIEYSSSLFIHMSPMLVTWTMRWNARQVRYRFGDARFSYMYDEALPSWQEMYGYPLAMYTVWWVVYGVWLLVSGIYLPDKGFDTVFAYNSRKSGVNKHRIFGKWSLRTRAVAYMLLHYVFAAVLLLWPLVCWQYKWVHTAWAAGSFAAACYQGASYYDYWLGVRYARALERMIEDEQKSK